MLQEVKPKNENKQLFLTKFSLFTKVDLEIGVVEKIILDSIEPFFEGFWS